ncbi:MAG: cold-shock protein [Alphaproteobacteria bacterium]|nr:MAG: cold-shock protein [Alphaproteobacteria bacterium]
MATGIVKWFNTEKGYGFIAPDAGGNDIFVHVSALKAAGLADLREEQPVSYELKEDQRGRQSAADLKLL